ncbi:hypothetical protein AAHB54_31525, partial [Bacillus cereus]
VVLQVDSNLRCLTFREQTLSCVISRIYRETHYRVFRAAMILDQQKLMRMQQAIKRLTVQVVVYQ